MDRVTFDNLRGLVPGDYFMFEGKLHRTVAHPIFSVRNGFLYLNICADAFNPSVPSNWSCADLLLWREIN